MKRVKVNGPGVKLANKWCYIGDEAIIDEEEYERNKEYVDVIEEIEEPQTEQEKNEENPEEEGTPEEVEGNVEEEEETPEEETDNTETEEEENPKGEDEELEALKDRAKELGINITHNMKKETIIKKIEKAEKEAGESQNPEGE